MQKTKKLTGNERSSRMWIAAILISFLCYAVYAVLSYYALNSSKWNITSGLITVSAVNVIMFMLYRKRTGIQKIRRMISRSNYLALVIDLGLSALYLAHNESVKASVWDIVAGMSFSNGKLITDLVAVLQKLPLINPGLVTIVILWLFYHFFRSFS